MAIGSIFDQGIAGIRNGLQGADRAAQQIASGAYGEPVRQRSAVYRLRFQLWAQGLPHHG